MVAGKQNWALSAILAKPEKKETSKMKKLMLAAAVLGALAIQAQAQTNATQIVESASGVMTSVIAVVGPAVLFFIGIGIVKKLRRA